MEILRVNADVVFFCFFPHKFEKAWCNERTTSLLYDDVTLFIINYILSWRSNDNKTYLSN